MDARPLQNAPFCPISASSSNFNPRNTQCMDACPDGVFIGVVKIIAFLELEQKCAFFKGLDASFFTVSMLYLNLIWRRERDSNPRCRY